MNITILILCTALNTVQFDFLNKKPLYEEPLAAPRSPEMGMTINTEKYMGKRIYYLEGILGFTFPIITITEQNYAIQFGIQASTWVDLGYKDGAFPLLTQDFLLSIPLSFRYKDFSTALKFNHISSHLGDGMDVLLEQTLSAKEKREYEFYDDLAESEGMDLSLREPKLYSRDFMSLHLGYDYDIRNVKSRMYFHIGYAHKMIPDHLDCWFVGNGIEFKYPMTYVAPYYAQDITWNQDIDTIDYSGQLGIIVLSKRDMLFTMRIAITAYIGSDRRGQMLGRKIKKFGLGLFIR